MSPIPASTQKLWSEYTKSFEEKSAKPDYFHSSDKDDWSWFELRYNGRTLKYTVKFIGNQPADGYPMFIGLHGGGTDTLDNNDEQWRIMIDQWYRKPVEDHVKKTGEGAVYIAARGVSTYDAKGNLVDTWNLHSQDESYVLLQRLVRGFFMPIPEEIKAQHLDGPFHTSFVQTRPFVDSNRVYLLGFSAGGDGALQHATRMPDIFSAVSAAGGHPNGVPFTNTTNLAFCISSGEKDSDRRDVEDQSGVKDRAREIVRNNFQLEDLRKNVREQLYYTVPSAYQALVQEYLFYPHDCIIVKGKGHGFWAGPGMNKTLQKVLTNLKSWLFHQENPNIIIEGADASTDRIINLVEWACSDPSSTPVSFIPRLRKPLPNFVIWDIATRPTATGAGAPGKPRDPWSPKTAFYWLYLRSHDAASLTDQVRAAYDKTTNSVWVDKATKYLALLLNEDMVDFSKDVYVCIGKGIEHRQQIKITPSEKLRRETLWHRGDPSFIFDALVYFVWNGNKWVAKVTDTLNVDAVPGVRSKL